MLGYLIWHGEGRAQVKLERRTIGGASFLVLEAWGSPRRLRRRLRRALGELRARGVHRCVIPEAWPEEWREDLYGIEEQGLRQALLPQLLDRFGRHLAAPLGEGTVLLSAPYADETVWRTARYMSRRCRYLLLDMEGAEPLRRALWEQYGVAAGGTLRRPALQMCFGEPTVEAPALLLGPGCQSAQRVEYDLDGPETLGLGDWPVTGQLVAALWGCGALDAGRIRVRSVDFRP